MFDHVESVVGLLPGERPQDLQSEEDLAFLLTQLELADGWVDDDRHLLPDDLDDLAPGPLLALIVSSVDPSRLNGHDLVRLMRARARLSSHHEATKYVAMAEIAFAPPSGPESEVLRSNEQVEYAALEVGAALSLTRRSSEDQLSRAVSLTGRLRRVLEVFTAGNLDLSRVRVFDDMLGHLPQETVDVVLDECLVDSVDMTTGQLRARLGRLVMVHDPDGSRSSYEHGLAERRVTAGSNPDHTANFGIYSAAPDRVAAARAHVEELAQALRTEGEERTLDQLRADVALGLLTGSRDGKPGGGGGVHVSITAETLTGLSDHPAELEGFGPVIAEIGRKTVMENIHGEWTFTVTDQGRPVATGTLSRRPSASQTRQITAEYRTCVMVNCRFPAHDCDLDHQRPVSAGGPTENDNLAPLCRHHHMARHHTQWRVVRLPNGDHQWTSPHGHTYINRRGPPD
jgi:hypothetical protein